MIRIDLTLIAAPVTQVVVQGHKNLSLFRVPHIFHRWERIFNDVHKLFNLSDVILRNLRWSASNEHLYLFGWIKDFLSEDYLKLLPVVLRQSGTEHEQELGLN